MPRTKIENAVSTAEVEVELTVDTKTIDLLELNLGREDLNKVVEKINEIITKVNK